jgi:hypothetical protein
MPQPQNQNRRQFSKAFVPFNPPASCPSLARGLEQLNPDSEPYGGFFQIPQHADADVTIVLRDVRMIEIKPFEAGEITKPVGGAAPGAVPPRLELTHHANLVGPVRRKPPDPFVFRPKNHSSQ